MRFLRQGLTGLFLLCVTAALLVMAANLFFGALQERMSRESFSPPQRERVFAVNVTTAEVGEIAPVMTVFGEIESSRTLDLRAATSGAIVMLSESFQEGGQVKEGDLLLRVDDADAQDALARINTQLNEAQAEVRDAERGLVLALDDLSSAQKQSELRQKALTRQLDLLDRGVGTEAAVETAELNLAAAGQSILSRRQAVAAAEARVDQSANALERGNLSVAEATRALEDHSIYAKFAGSLAEVNVVQGGLVTANERVAQLIDPMALEVAFRVSTAQYARLLDETGVLRKAEVTVAVDVSGIELKAKGRISRESASVAEGLTGRLVFATLEPPNGLRPGDFVTVAVQEPALQFVAALPSAALSPQNQLLVLNDDDRLEAMDVTLLRRQGDQVIVRARGLRGREVVAALSPVLGVGIKVRPVREGEADAPPPAPEMVALTAERRAKLVAFVEANQRMPAEAKQRVLTQLQSDEVPAQMVQRLEQRMGG